MKLKVLVGVLALAGCIAPEIAFATSGYFSQGYGMKAKGRAGASTAMADDTFGGANNPASMVWVGDRFDIGADWFRPIRSAERSGSANGLDSKSDSDSEDFFIPEFGYNKMLNPNLSLGVTVYGNGGMNTDYPGTEVTSVAGRSLCNYFQTGVGGGAGNPSYNMLCGSGRLGIDLMQLIIAPTVAFKINPNHSIGISPLLGYQRFKAEGLQAFAGMSAAPNNLTNNGYDNATGWGARIGWMGKLSNAVTMGAAYSTKIKMDNLDKYKGLFAEQGGFDMPENYSVGIAFDATPAVKVALDYQRINYGGVRAVNNPSTSSDLLGSDSGRGFGWEDVDVWKLGVEYKYNDRLTLRAGYGRSDNPIQSRDVTFNFLAPGVVQDHYTLGFSYGLDKNSELTMAYMHASEDSVSGASLFTSLGAGDSGNDKIKMYQDSLGIAYSRKF